MEHEQADLLKLIPKKQFGQHFLVQKSAIQAIVAAALAAPAPDLLEIGPGPGVLTEGLLADGRPLWAVDLDPDAIAVYRPLAEAAIAQTNNHGYERATQLLLMMRPLFAHTGEDFTDYVTALKETNRRKRNFLAELRRNGL